MTKEDNNAQPLPLLSTASSALKAQVTKLSLFAINTPFTPSALNTVLAPVNDSILPSLVTATLLITPNAYTKAFCGEARILTRTVLKDLVKLILEVKATAETKKKKGEKEEELSQSEKDAVTIATGHMWDSCDAVIKLAEDGVMGFLSRRVEEWRNLVRDAIEEIEDWDPDEEDDFFGLDDDDGDTASSTDEDRGDTAALHEQKKSTIRVLKSIAQIFPAIAANRLRNQPCPSSVPTLESLMLHLQDITGDADEAAGALYEGSTANSSGYLKKAKNRATDAIKLVVLPWQVDGERPRESGDKFTVWARTWLKVIDDMVDDAAKQ